MKPTPNAASLAISYWQSSFFPLLKFSQCHLRAGWRHSYAIFTVCAAAGTPTAALLSVLPLKPLMTSRDWAALLCLSSALWDEAPVFQPLLKQEANDFQFYQWSFENDMMSMSDYSAVVHKRTKSSTVTWTNRTALPTCSFLKPASC